MPGEAGERPLRIAVCGTGIAGPDVFELARQVGREIADAGAALVCGGLGGVMEGAARGAAERGGLTIGILPGRDAGDANPYIHIPLPTAMGEGRNVLVVRAADAVVAVAGAWGTLSEVALARKIGIPVVLLRPELTDGLDLEVAETPADAVRRALALARDPGA